MANDSRGQVTEYTGEGHMLLPSPPYEKSNKASYDNLWLSGPVDALKMAAVCLEIMATLESFKQ